MSAKKQNIRNIAATFVAGVTANNNGGDPGIGFGTVTANFDILPGG